MNLDAFRRFAAYETVPVLDSIRHPVFASAGVDVRVLRIDRVHPVIQGNKWFKLKHNLKEILQQRHHTVLTFGGAWSNHLLACALATKALGLKSIGMVRGERPETLNPWLQRSLEAGMRMEFLTRSQYRWKHEPDFHKELIQRFGRFYLLPEGGTNASAVKGCAEIIHSIRDSWDFLVCPVGTGGTMAGLILGAEGRGRILGVSALKGGAFLEDQIRSLLMNHHASHLANWGLFTDFHLGGFGKIPFELSQFITDFWEAHQIRLDPVYTGKTMMALFRLVENGYFHEGNRILVLHTGGLPHP